jgi:hypothetical protein
MTVPADLKSGIYAMRLRIGPGTGIAEEYIVSVVRPAKPTAKLAFLVPSASYLAYANESLSFDAQIIQPMTGQPPVVTDLDIETYEHREYGLSTYDHYEDDAGVCFSSYLRPIINMRPKYRMSSMNITWQFPADLSIVAWLDHMGYDCDFITDEDLHREGVDLLRPYLCVMTGTHPEYVSERMLDVCRRRRPAHLHGRQWLLLGRGLRSGKSCQHGGAQARFRNARLGGQTGRTLPTNHWRKERPVVQPRSCAAKANGRRLHSRGLRNVGAVPKNA